MNSKPNWTSLPGPGHFLDRVENCIRNTRSVISFVPACLDESWMTDLRGRLGVDFTWRDLRGGPSEFLQEVSNRRDGNAFIHCSELITEGIQQHLFCARRISPADWPAWEALLVRFSESQRAEDEFKRNVMLLHLEQRDFSERVGALFDVCSLHDNLLAEDAYFAASRLIQGGASRRLEDEIRMHIAAELALWDFDLCQFLCDAPLESLLEPSDLLFRYVDTREGGDKASNQVFEPAWSSAIRGRRSPVHSALVAKAGDVAELRRRVWRGQVQVLFPLIEEQRCLLIKQVERRAPPVMRKCYELQMLLLEETPHLARFAKGEVGGPDAPIEIGLLLSAMSHVKCCPPELKRYVWKLWNMRNKLAHLDVCSKQDLPTRNELLV